MTEISVHEKMPSVLEQFVLHWGDMGGQWGVNRSVSQIHALLYLSERPLTAEEIADGLGLARSNVSNSIKELQAWNLIRRVPIKGDRREHFEAEEQAALLPAPTSPYDIPLWSEPKVRGRGSRRHMPGGNMMLSTRRTVWWRGSWSGAGMMPC